MDTRWSIAGVALAGSIFILALKIPLPGLDMTAVFAQMSPYSGLHTSLSIFALGLLPLYTALILTELGRLLVRSRAEHIRDAGAVERLTVAVLAFAYATFQGYAIVSGLGSMGYLAGDTTTGILLGLVTYLGVCALTIFLCYRIRIAGFRNAFWALWSVPVLLDLPSAISGTLDLVRTGAVPQMVLLVTAGYFALCFAAISVAALLWKSACISGEGAAVEPREILIWPFILAFSIVDLLTLGFSIAAPYVYADFASTDLYRPTLLTLVALLTGLFVVGYVRQNKAVIRPGAPLAITVAILIAVPVLIMVLDALLDIIMPLPINLGVISILALALTALSLGRADVSEPAEERVTT